MPIERTAGLTHADIAQKFVTSGVINFEAMGRLITEIGPELAINDEGLHGVLIGKFNTLACVLQAKDLVRFGSLNAASLAARVVDSITDGGLS